MLDCGAMGMERAEIESKDNSGSLRGEDEERVDKVVVWAEIGRNQSHLVLDCGAMGMERAEIESKITLDRYEVKMKRGSIKGDRFWG